MSYLPDVTLRRLSRWLIWWIASRWWLFPGLALHPKALGIDDIALAARRAGNSRVDVVTCQLAATCALVDTIFRLGALNEIERLVPEKISLFATILAPIFLLLCGHVNTQLVGAVVMPPVVTVTGVFPAVARFGALVTLMLVELA